MIQAMLNGLSMLLTGEKPERRRYVRRRDSFKVWCAIGTKWVSAFGVDISASGLGIVAPVEMKKDEIEFRASLDDKQIVLRAKKVWDQPGTYHGQIVHRCGLKITGIAADDWDALVRYCNGDEIDVANRAQEELRVVRMQPDDVARLLPQRLQTRLLGMLVERKRLAPLDQKTPLVQYGYAGRIDKGGFVTHCVSVHSRIFDEETLQMRSHDTRFLVSGDGQHVAIDE